MSASMTFVLRFPREAAARRVSQQKGSSSMQASISNPARETPMSKPPAPEKRESAASFMVFLSRLPRN